MSNYEIASLVVAVIAIIVSVIALQKSSAVSQETLKLSHGMTELEVTNMITGTRRRVEDITILMLPLVTKMSRSDEESKQLEGYKRVLKAAMESNVNAYEAACAKYLDGKIDKVRFRKSYKIEVRNLVQDPNHREFFDAITSSYKAILKVYDEWENLEK